jgi:hypothetical protein
MHDKRELSPRPAALRYSVVWQQLVFPERVTALLPVKTFPYPSGSGQLMPGYCTYNLPRRQRTEARAMAVRLAARPASPDCAAATAATAAAEASAVAAEAVGAPAAAASRDAASAMLATRLAVMLPQAAHKTATGGLHTHLTGNLVYSVAFLQQRRPMCVMQAAPRLSHLSAAGSIGHMMQTRSQQTPKLCRCAVQRPSENKCKAAVASNECTVCLSTEPCPASVQCAWPYAWPHKAVGTLSASRCYDHRAQSTAR